MYFIGLVCIALHFNVHFNPVLIKILKTRMRERMYVCLAVCLCAANIYLHVYVFREEVKLFNKQLVHNTDNTCLYIIAHGTP